MGKSAKPRKKYKERAVHVPMMVETQEREATSLHMLVAAMIAAPTPDLYNAITRKMATYSDAMSHMRGGRSLSGDRDAAANALRSALLTLGAVFDRWDRTKAVAVTESEASSLKSASIILDQAIWRIPANVLKAAELTVAAHAANAPE